MILLETPRLILRNWEERDRALFHLVHSDPRVMRFFPARLDRAQSDVLFDGLRERIARTDFGFHAVEDKASGTCIGCAGLARVEMEPIFPDGTVEIGWRLAPAFWGMGYASEAGRALLAHAFGPLGLREVVSFTVHDNERSVAVMRRIGMRRDPDGDFDHPRVPDETPQFKRHVVWRARA